MLTAYAGTMNETNMLLNLHDPLLRIILGQLSVRIAGWWHAAASGLEPMARA